MRRFDEAEREIHAAIKLVRPKGAPTPRGLLLLNLRCWLLRLRAAPEAERSPAAAARARTVETMALANARAIPRWRHACTTTSATSTG